MRGLQHNFIGCKKFAIINLQAGNIMFYKSNCYFFTKLYTPLKVTPRACRWQAGFLSIERIKDYMSTHTVHREVNEIYFCTITCYKWLPLFEEACAYNAVYNWFEHLRIDGCHVLAYVIMPNHLHCLLFPTHREKLLNRLVGEGKRFMAYSITGNLKKLGKYGLLKKLAEGVQRNEKKKGKKHQVFRLSFDARICFDEKMVEQKLEYIHDNPVSGKWNLSDDFVGYSHSSAAYYELGAENKFVTHYKDIYDAGNPAQSHSVRLDSEHFKLSSGTPQSPLQVTLRWNGGTWL